MRTSTFSDHPEKLGREGEVRFAAYAGPVKWLLLVLVLLVLVFLIGVRLGRTTTPSRVTFTPVSELDPQVRADIDLALAQQQKLRAIKIYRDATAASLSSAKAAIEVYAARAMR